MFIAAVTEKEVINKKWNELVSWALNVTIN